MQMTAPVPIAAAMRGVWRFLGRLWGGGRPSRESGHGAAAASVGEQAVRGQPGMNGVDPSGPIHYSLVTANSAIRVADDRLEITDLDSPRAPSLTLEIHLEAAVWKSGSQERVEEQYELRIARAGKQAVVILSTHDRALARRAFADHAQDLIEQVALRKVDFCGTSGHRAAAVPRDREEATGGPDDSPRRASRLRRALLLVRRLAIVVLCLFALQVLYFLVRPQAAGRYAQGSVGPDGRPLDDKGAPQAWSQLTDKQKQLLLGLAYSGARSTGPAADPVPTPDQERMIAQTQAALNSGSLTSGPPTVASTPEAVPGAQEASTPPAALTAEQMKKIKAAPSLTYGSGKKVAYVFEDPLCPSCRDFALRAKSLGPDYSIVVLPIAFKNGAEPIASSALCAKDPKMMWSQAMAGMGIISSKPCADGSRKLQDNNQLFLSLGLRNTPTMIAPNGRWVEGSGEQAAIEWWITKQSKT